MTTHDFIITLFCAVDQEMLSIPKRPGAKLYPSEVVTLALLYALKGEGTRAFYRWLTRDYQALFPQVPGADALVPPLPDPYRLDGPLSGGPHGARGGGHLWH